MTGSVRHLFTASEAELWLGIPAGTVRSWASRKQIFHYGLTDDGRKMFDRDDLVRLGNARRSERSGDRDLT